MSTEGTIPRSSALAEIETGSLSEAIARWDTAVQAQTHRSPQAQGDLKRIIEANRKMRERWEATEAAGGQKAAPAGARVPLLKKSAATLDDLF